MHRKWISLHAYTLLLAVLFLIRCGGGGDGIMEIPETLTPGLINYVGTPESPEDRHPLVFSDEGAWFGYGFPDKQVGSIGFSGPFLMTRDNGVWISPQLGKLELKDPKSGENVLGENPEVIISSFHSHMTLGYSGKKLKIIARLFFISPHTAFIHFQVHNHSNREIELSGAWTGELFLRDVRMEREGNHIRLEPAKGGAPGFIRITGIPVTSVLFSGDSYRMDLGRIRIGADNSESFSAVNTFIFPQYSQSSETANIKQVSSSPLKYLRENIREKGGQLKFLFSAIPEKSDLPELRELISKSVLTMQNNWRAPAGELKHAGLFPSYNYKWFHGFWAWDSWKHAAALSLYDPELAKEQVRAMYGFQQENGMIADCVYRDPSIEAHNVRNTKPPLSAWAVWKIYLKDGDPLFLREMLPKLEKQHRWWYRERDHDGDGICEYGSTDGTLTAAKWESGMDNGVRFDASKLLQNSDTAWSLDQESVDLNAYLYAEKIYLSKITEVLGRNKKSGKFRKEAGKLKNVIRFQFFHKETGWFYDTSLDGKHHIQVKGCEGWIPLWAGAASEEQAEQVKDSMVDPAQFNGRVPLQTLSADHPKFSPSRGYWRGPVWLDQAYFGIAGLKRYGFRTEAEELQGKLLRNTEGVLGKGGSLRENYNPVTGKGLNARNFSWTAAHFMLLLLDE